ncbi:MAG: hypothetical protein SF053_08180 [Bacteroidia bacterium]|nr:hypothetical protein [Bacteroidia bacterium]
MEFRKADEITHQLEGTWMVRTLTLSGQKFPLKDTVIVLSEGLGQLNILPREDPRHAPCEIQRVIDTTTLDITLRVIPAVAKGFFPTLSLVTAQAPTRELEWTGQFTFDSLTDTYLAFSCIYTVRYGTCI